MTSDASLLISTPISAKPSLLQAADLSISYGSERILQDVNLTINEGDIQLVLGGNGAGKSSFLRVLAGIQTPTRGSITRSLPITSVGFVSHAPMLYGSLTVEQNLKLFSDLYSTGNQVDSRTTSDTKAARTQGMTQGMTHGLNYGLQHGLEFWDLRKLRSRLPHQLSRGQLARVAICRAVINAPQLLILDEPGANLDDYWRGRFHSFLETALGERRIKSAIIASHDTSDLSNLVNQVLVLNRQSLEMHTTDVTAGIQYHLRNLR